jgi:hypothetical protein
MPTCQPRYETRGCKWAAVLRHSVLLVRITSRHVIQCCWSGSRLDMSILTTCRPSFFTEVLQPLPFRHCWCPSFSKRFCKPSLQKMFNSLNKSHLRVAVTSSSLLVTLQLDSKRYSLDGSYQPQLQYTRANALLDNTVGGGGGINALTDRKLLYKVSYFGIFSYQSTSYLVTIIQRRTQGLTCSSLVSWRHLCKQSATKTGKHRKTAVK